MPGLNTRTAVATVVACLAVACPPAPAYADDEGQRNPPAAAAGRSLLERPGVHVRPKPGAPALPQGLSSLSWVVSDARTGQVLAAKDAHRRLPPASTLKTLFAVTVLSALPQDGLRTVKARDLMGIGAGSSLVGIRPGHRYTVSDLWRGVFLRSGNDAVHALAAMNGSMPKTVRQMQAKARALGALDTHVVTPDGYDAPGQVSSAYDLSVIARAGLADPRFVRYSSTRTAHFPKGRARNGKAKGSFAIQNTNRLLVGAPGLKRYPGLIGVKNGYTTRAGNTLVAAARRGGRILLVTVMNPRSGQDNAVYREARALLDWGFAASGKVSSLGPLGSSRGSTTSRGLRRPPVMGAMGAPSVVSPDRERDSRSADRPWLAAGAASLVVACGAVTVVCRRRTRRDPART